MPPLPNPQEVLGPEYANYTWIYDENYKVVQYDLTALDKTTMTNIAKKSSKLYAHAVMTWFLTILVLWRLSLANKYALNLRLLFFMSGGGDVQGRSVLVRDIPLKTSSNATSGKDGDDDEDGVQDDSTSWFARKFGKTLTRRRTASKTEEADGDEGKLRVVLPDRWDEAASKVDGVEGRDHSWLVQREFEELYGKLEVVDSQAVYNTAKLAGLVGSYEKTKEAAFAACDKVVSTYANEKKREKMKKVTKTVVGKTMGKWGTEKYGLKPKKVRLNCLTAHTKLLTLLANVDQPG